MLPWSSLVRRRLRGVGRGQVSAANPLAHVTGRVPSPHGEIEARALLELLWLVEPRERKVLILVGGGEQVSEVARSLGMPLGTAFSRLRRGRRRLAAVLKRWCRLRQTPHLRPDLPGGQVSEIARSLGLPIGTAFSRLRRGRRLLATVLKRRRRMRQPRPGQIGIGDREQVSEIASRIGMPFGTASRGSAQAA